jgi:hypothetical protein
MKKVNITHIGFFGEWGRSSVTTNLGKKYSHNVPVYANVFAYTAHLSVYTQSRTLLVSYLIWISTGQWSEPVTSARMMESRTDAMRPASTQW